MTLTAEQEKGQKLMDSLVKKAWENAAFKEQLIKNPEVAIQQVTGEEFKPANERTSKIIVEDQSDPNIIYLNIPRKINYEDILLSEKELESISGGITIVIACAAVFWIGVEIGDQIKKHRNAN